mmetsp:Transcript_36968/g.80807  ORF Transcript_36968/g.80807 Transcript_36968/m.80807 type:complete len:292 (+) Transcript_36968:143-1018(+)
MDPQLPYSAKAGRKKRSKRTKKINILQVLWNAFAPWLMFSILYCVISFRFRYWYSSYAWGTVLVGYCVVLQLFLRLRHVREERRDDVWHYYAVISMFIWVSAAAVLGDVNFWYNMRGFYDNETLNTYPHVDPSCNSGAAMMDAGRVYFSVGVHVEPKLSIGFKNVRTYCVAPIVKGNIKLQSYDFWAVGVDCCTGATADFRCGQYNNPSARSGLRLMSDTFRDQFRLAVQQAAATYKIKAEHPLFFSWLEDPVAEMVAYRSQGYKMFVLASLTAFAVNLFSIFFTMVLFQR